MNGCILNIKGRWGHFKRPETNNNPLTHDLITKTGLIGLIGAVLGKNRAEMRDLFPVFSDGFLYGVTIISAVKKESWAFTMRSSLSNLSEKAPKHMEFLVNPEFEVALVVKNQELEESFQNFVNALKANEAIYTPVLGLHNCPAELELVSIGQFETRKGEFSTTGFFTKNHKISLKEISNFRLGFDKIPTYQNNDFWNLPERYVEIIYPSEKKSVTISGEFFEYSFGSCWVLV